MRCSHGERPAGAVVRRSSRYRRHLLPSLQGFSRTHSSPLLTAYQHTQTSWAEHLPSSSAEVALGPLQSSLLRFTVLCAIRQEKSSTNLSVNSLLPSNCSIGVDVWSLRNETESQTKISSLPI